VRRPAQYYDDTITSTPLNTDASSTDDAAAAAGSVLCAPILNADGHVIAVALLSNKMTSADGGNNTFSDQDEKVT